MVIADIYWIFTVCHALFHFMITATIQEKNYNYLQLADEETEP